MCRAADDHLVTGIDILQGNHYTGGYRCGKFVASNIFFMAMQGLIYGYFDLLTQYILLNCHFYTSVTGAAQGNFTT